VTCFAFETARREDCGVGYYMLLCRLPVNCRTDQKGLGDTLEVTNWNRFRSVTLFFVERSPGQVSA
jgi:hypothetical protein